MRTKVFKLLILLFISFPIIIGCANVLSFSGQWQGKMVQQNGPRGLDGYTMFFNLKQNDSLVTGTSRIEIPYSPYYAEMKVRGTIKNDTLFFKELDITKQNARQGYFWCIKKGSLQINPATKILEGNWSSNGCEPGIIYMVKMN